MLTGLREQHGWILYLLPLAGLVIVWAYHVTGMADDKGTEYIIGAVREGRNLRIRTAPLIFLSTVLTHLCGGSAGREGAALQLGGSMSNFLGRVVHLNEKDDRIITMCGMAAGFSAPVWYAAGGGGHVHGGGQCWRHVLFGHCALRAVGADCAGGGIVHGDRSHGLCGGGGAGHDAADAFAGGRFGHPLCSGGGAVLLVTSCIWRPRAMRRSLKNPYLKVILGGVIVVLLSLLLGTDYNGAGVAVINRAMEGQARPEAFLLKIIFTALTLAAGFKGGEIVPAFFCGAAFGAFYGELLGWAVPLPPHWA